jgi:N6-L-threonylcarbamoyladenine synthase
MIILAIETSCDETAISILEATDGFLRPKFKILSNIVASQIKIHAKWGGVVPNLAKREHLKNLPVVLKKALVKSKIKIKNIDLISVTVGPGLEPALWTGINFARDLSKVWDKPIIGINHMEGHIAAVLLKEKSKLIKFPALALLVSGGHTELVLIKDWLKYKIIGQTRDDAAGEAFDKVAKMLGLPYPGGPVVAKLADSHQSSVANNQIKLPRPMINSKDYDFSFSGLKTAVLYLLRDLRGGKFGFRKISLDDRLKGSQLPAPLVAEICYEFQQAVIDVLISKTIRAAKEYKIKTIILGGGVAANKELRKQLGKKIKKELPITNYLLPVTSFTTDNATMIAAAAYLHALKKEFTKPSTLKAQGNLILK